MGAEVNGRKKWIDYIPYIRSIYLVCMCVLSSQGLWPIIATERKKGSGANLYAYKISVLILSISPENVTINQVIICRKLRYSKFKTRKPSLYSVCLTLFSCKSKLYFRSKRWTDSARPYGTTSQETVFL